MPLPRLLSAAIVPLTLLALAAPALADTTLSTEGTASNVTTYGSTTIWSVQLADRTWGMEMSTGGGAPTALAVAGSPVPFDPDLGPAASGGSVAVYTRCSGSSATSGCDVYSYTVATGVEAKITAISKPATSESAPSYWKGWVAFSRSGGSRPGTYWYKPGKPLMRLDTKPAAETDSSDIMVAYIRRAGGSTSLRTTNFSGTKRRLVAKGNVAGSGDGDILTSPSVQRYQLYFLDRSPVTESATIKRTGIRNPNRGTAIITASPTPAGDIQSISAFKQPIFYTRSFGGSGAGLFVTDPAPSF